MASHRRISSPFGETPRPLSLITIQDIENALITNIKLEPGQVVLTESPLLIYPYCFNSLHLYCSQCFSVLPSEPLPCSRCNVALFCSQRCQSLSHPSLLCHALPKLATCNRNRADLMFLLSAYSLPGSDINLLLSLHPRSRQRHIPGQSIEILHSRLTSLICDDMVPLLFSRDVTSSLISKEKSNSFTLPIGADVPRACGLYLWASMINHDCLPNVCRFDNFRHPELQKNTDLIFRALHTIEKGSEIRISYVDLNMEYTERQDKLLKRYQFECKCTRCMIESKNGDYSMIDDYLNTYICECGGLLAYVPPSQDGTVSDLRECNHCGHCIP